MDKYLIKTPRLGLRFIQKEDLKYLKTVEKDPEAKEFFPEGVLKDEEIKKFINECITSCSKRQLPCLVIFKLNNDKFVGEAYFDQIETGEIKVGYLFCKEYWHKGYATEVLQTLLKWAKKYIDSKYIIAYADKRNKASFRVMRKCGMSYYKSGRYLGMDCNFYRIKN